MIDHDESCPHKHDPGTHWECRCGEWQNAYEQGQRDERERITKALESNPSSKSALRLPTLFALFTANGAPLGGAKFTVPEKVRLTPLFKSPALAA